MDGETLRFLTQEEDPFLLRCAVCLQDKTTPFYSLPCQCKKELRRWVHEKCSTFYYNIRLACPTCGETAELTRTRNMSLVHFCFDAFFYSQRLNISAVGIIAIILATLAYLIPFEQAQLIAYSIDLTFFPILWLLAGRIAHHFKLRRVHRLYKLLHRVIVWFTQMSVIALVLVILQDYVPIPYIPNYGKAIIYWVPMAAMSFRYALRSSYKTVYYKLALSKHDVEYETNSLLQ